MSKSNLLLSVRNVSNFYKERSKGIFSKGGKTRVLDDVSFEVCKGEVFGIVGESGCGKSTLSKAILNLINFTGEITIDGISVRDKKKDIRKDIQIIFQDPKSALNPMKRIGWIMEEPLRVHKIGNDNSRKKEVIDMLNLVGLDESFYNRYPHELSGGQQQRLCIARTLAVNPEVILMDEPTSALDPISTLKIEELIMRLKKEYTIIIVTHNMQQAARISDKTAFFLLGEVIEYDDTNKIFNKQKNKKTQDYVSGRFG